MASTTPRIKVLKSYTVCPSRILKIPGITHTFNEYVLRLLRRQKTLNVGYIMVKKISCLDTNTGQGVNNKFHIAFKIMIIKTTSDRRNDIPINRRMKLFLKIILIKIKI